MHGTTQDLYLDSDPQNIRVVVDDQEWHVVTPTYVTLERKSDHTLKFSHPGYEDAKVQIETAISAIVVGNVLCGGFVGVAVDAVSGAINHLSPEKVYVILIPTTQPN